MADKGKILVLVDLAEGCLDETGRGLLSYGARLSGVIGLPWAVVLPAAPKEEALAGCALFGVPEVTVLEDGEHLKDTPGLLARVVAEFAQSTDATVLVFPHDDLGATLAPVAAAALQAAIFTEVASVSQGENGVELTRQAVGLRLSETKSWDGVHRLVLTVPTRCLSQVLMATVKASSPVPMTFRSTVAEGASSRVTQRIPPDPQTVDLSEAEVIFSAGKGCDQASFDQLQELCRLLNVSCGVTRPVYDLGYTGFERMVGQTGRTVTPRLYLALGISGSMHHVGGIKDSRRIVAVNSDAKAPIFPNADEGYVADLKEILPRLIERAKSALGGVA